MNLPFPSIWVQDLIILGAVLTVLSAALLDWL
jgi:hypothetical protein